MLKLGCLVVLVVSLATANPDALVRVQVGQVVQPTHLVLVVKLMMMVILILM